MLIGYLTGAYSQYTTSTFYPSMDAHVASGASANTNFGSNQYIQAFHQIQQQTQTVYRSYLQFDLSSIPTNAIIIDAQLKLTPYYQDNTGSQNDLYIQRVDSLWTDSTITWNNQPIRINSNQVSIPHNQTTSTSQHSYGVRNFIQHMVNNPHLNKGLAIQLQNEQDTHAFGLVYYSNDAQAYKPELEVFWMDPIDVSFDVTHCTNGNSDGSVDVSFNYSGTPRSIILYKFERDTTVDVKTNSTTVYSYTNYPSKTNHTINNLAPGVYGVITFDSTYYTNGNLLDCRLDKYFLVGEEGEVTEGLFSTTSFHEMTQLSKNKRDSTESLTHWEDMNGWEISTVALNISETRYPPQTSTEWQYVNKSLMEYPIDWDPGLIYDEAMFGGYAYTYFQRYANSTNDVYYYPITEDWQYKKVTWNTQPEVDTSTYIYIPTTTTIGNDPDRRDSVDLLPFVEYWQEHPNYGFRAELANQNQGDFANRGYRRPYSNNTGFLQVSFRVKPKIETTFDEETYLGEITVNAPAGDLPYLYILAKDSIINLDTLYQTFLNDSIPFDSNLIFNDWKNSRSNDFSNMLPGKYYVSVFDSNHDLIMLEGLVLTSNINVFKNIDVDVTNNSFSPNASMQSNGVLEFEEMFLSNDNFEFEFEIESDGELILGYKSINDTILDSLQHFIYAIKLSGSGYMQVGGENFSTNSYSIQINDVIKISREGNDFILHLNGEEKERRNLSSEFQPLSLSATFLDLNAAFKRKYKGGKISKRRPIFKINYPECGQTQATVDLLLPLGCTLNYADFDNNHSPFTAYHYTSFSSETFEIGSYTLEFAYSYTPVSGLPVSYLVSNVQFAIGYPVVWENLGINSVYEANPSSLFKSVYTTPWSHSGTGKGLTTSGELNWVQFESYVGGLSYSTPIYQEESFNIVDINTSENLVFVRTTNYYGYYPTLSVLGSGAVVNNSSLSPNNIFRIDELNDDYSVFYNGLSIYSGAALTSGPYNIEIYQYGAPKYNTVIASWCANYNPFDQYIEPKRELEGGYYVLPDDNVLRFEFYEEYALGSNLSFKIWDSNGDDITDFYGLILSEVYGDNRLDLTIPTGVSPGFYILEITNDKGENWYLRFKKV